MSPTQTPGGSAVQRFLGNLSVYAFVSLFNRAIAFATIPIVAAYIGGVEAYGVKEYIEFLIVLAATVSQGEIVQALVRYLSGASTDDDDAKVIWTCASFLLASGLVLVVPVVLFSADVSALIFDDRQYADAIVCGVLIVFFNAFFRLGLSVFEARRQARVFASFALSKLVVEVTLKLVLLIAFDMGYMAVLVSVLIADMLFGAAAFAHIGQARFRAPEMAWLRRLLAFSIPVLATNLCMLAVHQIDRVFLMEFSGLAATGIYGIAWKFGTIVNAVLFAGFGRAWFPAVFAIEDTDERNRFVQRTSLLFIALSSTVTLAGMLLAGVAMLLLPAEYAEALPLVRLVLFGYLFWFLYQIFSMPLFLHMRTKQVFFVSTLGLVANVVLNWFLVPPYGAAGAAIATVLTYALLSVAIDAMARGAEKSTFDRLRLYGLVALSGIVFVLWQLSAQVQPHWIAQILTGVAGLTVFVVVAAALTGMPLSRCWEAGRVALKGR